MPPGRAGAGRDGVRDAGMLSCRSSASAALPPCRSSGAAAPALCKQGGSLPVRGPGCQIPAKSTFLQHDSSEARHGMQAGGPRLCHAWMVHPALPAPPFSSPRLGEARQILQNILFPFAQGAPRSPDASWSSPPRPSPSFLCAPFPGRGFLRSSRTGGRK